MPPTAPPHAELGDDLRALVAAVGQPLVEVTPLSRRGATAAATTFRLRFADGSVRKGTRLADAEHASRVASLVPALGDGVPRLIAHGGAALLCEWVEGATLAAGGYADALLRACGAWQARVHGLRPGDGAESAPLLRRWRRRVDVNLDALCEAGLLRRAEAAQAAELARRYAPAECTTGISLGDFCPENIVCRGAGAPCLIDVETLSIAPCDYDLARTWYRWPMRATERAAYLDGYRVHRDPAAFLAGRPFWLIAALANGAVFRCRERGAEVDVPLAALRAVLREAGDPTAAVR